MNAGDFGERVDRWILKKGFRAKWPLTALTLIEARRIAVAPGAKLKNRRLARSLTHASQWVDRISREEGYRLFLPSAFSELPEIVAASHAVYERHQAEVTDNEAYNKHYFFNILTAEDLHRHPVLADFALSAPMTESIAGYLGELPRFHSLGVFYSSVNDTIDGSQMFHVDGDALTQIKCFINIWDVKPGNGPLTFLPKKETSFYLRTNGLLKTISDTDVWRIAPKERQVAVVGPPGSGVLVDTSRCLHQGSRARELPRLVFQFQYVTRPDVLVAKLPGKVVPGGHLLVTRQLLDGLSLSNPNAMMFVGEFSE